MRSFPLSSPLVVSVDCGSGRAKEPSGANVLRLIRIRLATLSLAKILPANLYDLGLSGQVLHACGLPAVSFWSARTMKRFP